MRTLTDGKNSARSERLNHAHSDQDAHVLGARTDEAAEDEDRVGEQVDGFAWRQDKQSESAKWRDERLGGRRTKEALTSNDLSDGAPD